ncbi:PglL family O-oligosaccharyltransferase [Vitreoscilla stercoraria]|uniref:Wzy polymerase domain-containing protein n=1 Tax=Vitreoscilla stercoraria TaxID=61 RepID=A0ABY4ECQ4_VITST|nr:Wzy polymerase domain-containing protein [Vitreoscilla stercoraria]UOO93227.1 Wzy polymerase domain-containing protein [Vitreoscilla stercoraria]
MFNGNIEQKTVVQIKAVRLCLGYILAVMAVMSVVVVPFLMNRRIGPQTGLIIESVSIILALLLVMGVALMGYLRHKPPLISMVFIGFAAWIAVQGRLLGLDWLSQIDLAAMVVLVAAVAAWALHSWQQESDVDVFRYLAWGLVLGVLLQSAVMWLQYFGLTKHFHGYLSYSQPTNIMGQLGQRNHLGHYLMWGMVVILYLQQARLMSRLLAALLIAWLGLSIGLIGSRTLIVYLLVIGFWACVWRLRVGKAWQASWYWTMGALLWVLAVQFGLKKVLAFFSGATTTTGLERVTAAKTVVDSARSVEWLKAWQAFLNSPWWGHGWGSGASQSFWRHGDGLLSARADVLFTHNHNTILQLLLEVGVIGCVGLLIGLLCLVWRCVVFAKRPESFAILAMVSVSLCHSLLEYPLWYVYFLLPFALFLALVPHHTHRYPTASPHSWHRLNMTLGILALVALLGTVRLLFVYQDIVSVYGIAKGESAQVAQQKKAQINALLKHEYLLYYYVGMALMERSFSPYQDMSVNNEVENARVVATYRPYPSYAIRWGMYQYRMGQRDEATAWLEQVWRYYPNQLDGHIKAMQNSPYYVDLLPLAQKRCLEYRERIKIKCSFAEAN